MKIGLALLNRNEEVSLRILLPKIEKELFAHVFAVDGNSIDRSVKLLEEFHIPVLRQTSSGRGNAFKIAFQEAEKKGLGALVFLSTDGNEDPTDLPKFIEELHKGFELVIASRMMAGAFNEEDISFFRPRKWANKIFARLAWTLHGKSAKRISDPINGYRAIRADSWKAMNISAEAFDVEFQSSIRAYQLGIRYIEFPTREGQRIGGKSGATALKTSIALAKVLFEKSNWIRT